MTRGDIVTVAAGSGFTGKPRPALIVQDTAYLGISTIVLALITSDDRASQLSISVPVTPSATNGLRVQSYVTVHELVTVRREKLDKHVGKLEEPLMRRVDHAIILFLGLDRG
ncbi:type II toxin-antitoxin system PemK/MazF family toxin [Sphingomonas sp. PsM26]|nr:type II toxin-antitoxin system PemK/MazF family toxin [Sphingomonas sp. PsM26]